MQSLLAIIKITSCTVRFLYCGITRIYFTEKKKPSADKITYQKYAKMFPLHLAKAETAFFFCILIWRPKKYIGASAESTSPALHSTTQGDHLLPFIKGNEKGSNFPIGTRVCFGLRLVCSLGYLLISGKLKQSVRNKIWPLSFTRNMHTAIKEESGRWK